MLEPIFRSSSRFAFAKPIYRPFGAGVFLNRYLGLKPQAESYRPFVGAETESFMDPALALAVCYIRRRDNPRRSPLSGRFRVGSLPRAKALGYSVLPFHGRFCPTAPYRPPRWWLLAPQAAPALVPPPAAGSAAVLVSRYGLGDRSENKRTPSRIFPSAFSADCPPEQS